MYTSGPKRSLDGITICKDLSKRMLEDRSFGDDVFDNKVI